MQREELAIIVKQTALSAEFLSEIGRITAHFAILEYELAELIHSLL